MARYIKVCHAEGELLDPGLPSTARMVLIFNVLSVSLTHSRAEQEALEGAGHPEAQGAHFPVGSEPGKDGINMPFTLPLASPEVLRGLGLKLDRNLQNQNIKFGGTRKQEICQKGESLRRGAPNSAYKSIQISG